MLGIMQGRLSPPVGDRLQCFPVEGDWRLEFENAERLGLQHVELIYGEDEFGSNPLDSFGGITELLELQREYGTLVRTVCADIFVNRPLLRCEEAERQGRMRLLRWLISVCHFLRTRNLVIPFVDNSEIRDSNEIKTVGKVLRGVVQYAEINGVYLCLETNLAPREFGVLLGYFPTRFVRVNYDSGNSAALGYSVRQEWGTYGERIGNVHIKDRARDGKSVPLGEGSVDWLALNDSMELYNYRHDCTLQVARGEPGSEVEWALENKEFVEKHLAAAI